MGGKRLPKAARVDFKLPSLACGTCLGDITNNDRLVGDVNERLPIVGLVEAVGNGPFALRRSVSLERPYQLQSHLLLNDVPLSASRASPRDPPSDTWNLNANRLSLKSIVLRSCGRRPRTELTVRN